MDIDTRVKTEIRKAAVAREIFCQVTQQVMDVRTAVLIESATSGKTLAILSPDGWRQRREELTKAHNMGRLRLVVDNAPADAPFEPLETEQVACKNCEWTGTKLTGPIQDATCPQCGGGVIAK